jgi:hypothetical protein
MRGRNTVCTLAIAALISLAGCAATKPGTGYIDDTPDEIQRLIEKSYKNGLYSVGTAFAADEAMARTKAVMQARAEIARQFKVQIDALQKGYEESVGGAATEEYSQVVEIFAMLELDGSAIAKSMVRRGPGDGYSAKVLVVVSAQRFKALVDEKMRAYTSYKASQAYKDLEGRVRQERKQRADTDG